MLLLPLLLFLQVLSIDCSSTPQYPADDKFPVDRFLLVKPYTRWNNKFLSLGSVMTTMSELRLTPDLKSSNGAIWTRQTLGLDAFTVEARLRISARSTSMVADGMGVWFTEQTSLGNAYGIAHVFTGFGIVLDTYDNTYGRKTPFLALVASNGTKPVNNDNNAADHVLQSCKVDDTIVHSGFDHNSKETIILYIEYTPGKLSLYYSAEDSAWRHCFTRENIFIPHYFYLGVSGSTGDISSQQDLISLKVFELPVDASAPTRKGMHFEQTERGEGEVEKKRKEGGEVLSLIFFTLAFFIVVGGLIIMIKPDLLPGTQASLDRKKRFY